MFGSITRNVITRSNHVVPDTFSHSVSARLHTYKYQVTRRRYKDPQLSLRDLWSESIISTLDLCVCNSNNPDTYTTLKELFFKTTKKKHNYN